MATDSARLSVTLSNNQQRNSSQNSTSTSTFSSGAECAPYKSENVTCGTCLGPNQITCQHVSALPLPTPSISSSPVLSNQNSEVKSRQSDDWTAPVKSERSTLKDLISTCRVKFSCAVEYTRITKVSQRERSGQDRKLLNTGRFRKQPHLESETERARSTGADIFKLWKWEILSCVLSAGMLGLLYGILQYYDGQRIPDWGSAMNLSTLIALIATLLRAALSSVVAEIIGQAKWKYFASTGRSTGTERPPLRQLIKTSRFNDASQGLLGTIKLIPTVLIDSATLLAVTVMIVLLGIGSFTQQAIQTKSCQFPVESVSASLPISRNITSGGATGSGLSDLHNLPNLAAALSNAFAPENEEIGSPISVKCPTGNCTFQDSLGGMYSTLGICSLCTDTSSLITSIGRAKSEVESRHDALARDTTVPRTNYTLPNGMTIEAYSAHTTFALDAETPLSTSFYSELLVSASRELGLDWAGDLVSPEMKALSHWAFANVTVLSPTSLQPGSAYTDYVAATCTLYPCLRSYKASVVSGKLDEVLVSTDPLMPNMSVFSPQFAPEDVPDTLSGDDWDLSMDSYYDSVFKAVQSPCHVNDKLWTEANQSSTLEIERLLLIDADIGPSGAPRFTVENITAPAECIYTMDAGAWGDLRELMVSNLFEGNCSLDSEVGSAVNKTLIKCGTTFWLSRIFADSRTSADTIISRFEAFADRLSNKIRMGLLNKPEAISGQVFQATICSTIHYRWLTYPAILVVITSGLLAWTIFRTSRYQGREMVWKTSILPFLYYGDRFVVQNGEDMSAGSTEASHRDDEAEEPTLLDLDQMEAEARQRVVRFEVFG